jgi:hypothetical protein
MFGVGSSFSIAFALTAKSDKKKKEQKKKILGKRDLFMLSENGGACLYSFTRVNVLKTEYLSKTQSYLSTLLGYNFSAE